MNLAKSIRVAMAMNDITNKQLAKDFSTSSQQVSSWRNGVISLDNIISLSEYFNLAVSDFIKLGE